MAERLDFSKMSFEDVIVGKEETTIPKVDKVKEEETPVVDDNPTPAPIDKDKLETPAEEADFYQSLTKIIGYEIDGEFDESVEGVAEYTKAVGQRIAEEEIKDLFDSFPDVKEFLQFRLNGGDPAKYFESKYGDVDYSKYAVDEKDETTQEVIVRKHLALQGFSDEEINDTIKDYKETNLLYKTAKKASERLIESQRTRKEAMIIKQAEQARIQESQREEMVAEISDVIDKGKLHNLIIPEKDRKEFRSWLLSPDGKGQTKRQATMAKLSVEQKLELEYLAFKGFDLKELVRREATATNINFLKKQAASKTSRLGGTGKETKPTNNLLKDLKLSELL